VATTLTGKRLTLVSVLLWRRNEQLAARRRPGPVDPTGEAVPALLDARPRPGGTVARELDRIELGKLHAIERGEKYDEQHRDDQKAPDVTRLKAQVAYAHPLVL